MKQKRQEETLGKCTCFGKYLDEEKEVNVDTSKGRLFHDSASVSARNKFLKGLE